MFDGIYNEPRNYWKSWWFLWKVGLVTCPLGYDAPLYHEDYGYESENIVFVSTVLGIFFTFMKKQMASCKMKVEECFFTFVVT